VNGVNLPTLSLNPLVDCWDDQSDHDTKPPLGKNTDPFSSLGLETRLSLSSLEKVVLQGRFGFVASGRAKHSC
jgi:hypothetical protein